MRDKLPPAVSTSEFYLLALVGELQALNETLGRLEAALAVSGHPAQGEMAGLDEERLVTLLSSIKGIGDVTARRIVESYKANTGQ